MQGGNGHNGGGVSWSLFIAVASLIIAAGVGTINYYQLKSTQDSVQLARRNMQIDQRAWIYPEIPNFFAFTGPTIPAEVHLSNIGKTVASNITGSVIATTFKRGETPQFDEYGIGHPHANVYAGALYPTEKPLDIPLTIVSYGDKPGELPTPIVPTPDFVRQFNSKEVFIIFFGRIEYCDVFEVKHWVTFCNGSGGALGSDGIKQCINYNRADNNDTADKTCKYPPSAN